jgi:hypothetical protein
MTTSLKRAAHSVKAALTGECLFPANIAKLPNLSDKVALSCAVPVCKSSGAPEYDFLYPFGGGSVGVSPYQQSFPTLRHFQPKFPVVRVGSLRGKAVTLVDLFLEKICFVEDCHNQKVRSGPLSNETFVRY